MSTQRRENRWQRSICTKRVGALGQKESTPIAKKARAYATVGTAPPHITASFHPSDKNPSPGTPARLATNSLQSDHRTKQLVGQDRHGSPPSQAGNRTATGTPATCRSPHPLISSPSAFEPIHTASPHLPAGLSRWMERYDGKRNLYLQHAA
jgi:hypothetical protein